MFDLSCYLGLKAPVAGIIVVAWFADTECCPTGFLVEISIRGGSNGGAYLLISKVHKNVRRWSMDRY